FVQSHIDVLLHAAAPGDQSSERTLVSFERARGAARNFVAPVVLCLRSHAGQFTQRLYRRSFNPEIVCYRCVIGAARRSGARAEMAPPGGCAQLNVQAKGSLTAGTQPRNTAR